MSSINWAQVLAGSMNHREAVAMIFVSIILVAVLGGGMLWAGVELGNSTNSLASIAADHKTIDEFLKSNADPDKTRRLLYSFADESRSLESMKSNFARAFFLCGLANGWVVLLLVLSLFAMLRKKPSS